jgi:sn-glycerol 3-phosphate transport system ATP-binding protein
MRLEIQRLHARLATTSLYVTHDQIEAMTLAQRVIVMNKGHAEQIGAPTEVYERPATVFVASFIGSPGMTLLEGRVSDDGATFDVAGNGPKLPLTGVASIGREVAKGREWTLGIRPEHMSPDQADGGHATLTVDSCELLGADNLAHGRWGKHDVTVRLPHAHRPAAGDALQVALPARHLHFFDPATGRRAN